MLRTGIFTLAILILSGFKAIGQGYHVEVTVVNIDCSGLGEDILLSGDISLGGISQSFVTPGLPDALFVHDFSTKPSGVVDFVFSFSDNLCGLDFVESKAINLEGINACVEKSYFINTNFNLEFSVQWTPVSFKIEDPVSSPPDNCYFKDDPITLTASSGYSDYQWEYAIQGGAYQSFAIDPGNTNQITLTWDDVFGTSGMQDTTVLFRSVLGSCTAASVASPYQVGGVARPGVDASSISTNPSCSGVNSGSINAQINRDPVSDEQVIFNLYSEPILETAYFVTQFIGVGRLGQFDNLDPGTYYLLIESNKSYCGETIFSDAIIVNSLDPITFPAPTPSPINCFGETSSLTFGTISGGTGAGYEYSIDNGSSYSTSSTFDNLDPDVSYYLRVKDSQGCESANILVTIGSAPEAITASFVTYAETCSGASDGQLEIIPSGGTAPFTFAKSQTGTFGTNHILTGYEPGSYTAWIKDANGCEKETASFNIEAANGIMLNTLVNNPQCPGDNGTIEATASGGTGTITYSIDGTTYQPSSTFLMTAGIYTIFAKDGNNCVETLTNITVVDPLPISFSVNSVTTTCSTVGDGTLEIQNPVNGVAPYLYSIDGGSSFAINPLFQNLNAGTYSVAVQDVNGCVAYSNAVIDQPTPISGTFSVTSIACFDGVDGALVVTPSGGSGTGYTYLWSTGAITANISNLAAGEYSVVVTDGNGCNSDLLEYTLSQPPLLESTIQSLSDYSGYSVSCNGASDGSIALNVQGGSGIYDFQWSNGETTQDLSNLSADNYSVLITDSNNCQISTSLTLTEPSVLLASSIVISDVSCFGLSDGNINMEVEGGAPPYEYSNDGGKTWQSSSGFSSLSSGNYDINVRDSNQCTMIISGTQISEPPKLLSIIVDESSTICGQSNGSIETSTSGGSPPYYYNWENQTGAVVSNEAILTDSPGGVYSLTVTDDNGCTTMVSGTISNSDGPVITIEQVLGLECSDGTNGSATISVVGGVAPYDVQWEGGQSGLTASNLTAGLVTLNVTDSKGCLSVEFIDIPSPDAISLNTIDKTHPTCHAEQNGQLSVQATGGVGILTFEWLNGTAGPVAQNLGAGVYQLTIMDGNGCSSTFDITLSEPDPLEIVQDAIISPSCEGASDGYIQITPKGGSPPYNLQWSTGETTNELDNLAAGEYSVVFSDANNCTASQVFVVPEATPLTVELEDKIICNGQTLTLDPGIDALSYSWTSDNGFSSENRVINLSTPGFYQLEFEDQNNCLGTGSFSLSISNDLLNADFLMASEVFVGDTVIVIDISWPLPDSVGWILPVEALVLNSTVDYATLIFDESGIYEIGLEAHLAECSAFYSAFITVLKASNTEGGRFASEDKKLIQSFDIYPNPNEGYFTTGIILSMIMDIELSIIDLGSNRTVLSRIEQGKDEYIITFNMPNLPSGTYALALQAGGESAVVRMIKQ